MIEPVKLAVFDLNGTFYNKSSKDEFFKFICSKKPRKLRYWFEMKYYRLLLKLHQINQTEFKENFFDYLNGLPPEKVEAYAREFWNREWPGQFNQQIISRLDELRKNGIKIVCATGALEVYVKPLFEHYPVDALFGTRADFKGTTYLIKGKACKGMEKIERMEKHFGKPVTIVEAWSDSREPILDKAMKGWLVRNGEINFYKKPLSTKKAS
jgi:HAD superfamily phosphoserine phosphatase-like hydrolase